MKPVRKVAKKGGKAGKGAVSFQNRQNGEGISFSRGSSFDLLISGLDNDGAGIGLKGERRVAVAGALPADRCLVRVSHSDRVVISAALIKLLEPSPLRLHRPPCSMAATCLGCPLIPLRYGEQLRIKRQMLQSAADEYISLKGVEIPRLLTAERNLHYRTTAKLVVAGSYREPYIGIYRRASHDVVDLEDCPLHHPLINRIIKEVRNGIGKMKVPVYQERNRSGILRYLVIQVSESSGAAMVTFVTARRAFNEIHHLGRYLQQQLPQVEVLCQNLNSREGTQIFGQQDHFLTRAEQLQERVGEVELLISPRSFMQTQNDGARLLYQTAVQLAKPEADQQVLDLYCGIGGLSLTIAPSVKGVLGVEINREAVADARRNARLNRVENCRFEAADAEELLAELLEDRVCFDTVLLNPPRKGCAARVLEQLAAVAPARIVYISCGPQSLMHDLDQLIRKGYRLLTLQPLDLFPHTMHVESVALLEKHTSVG